MTDRGELDHSRDGSAGRHGGARLHRRQVLGLGAGAGFGAVLAACGGSSTSARRGAICAPPTGLSKIDHVVVVMQENRSFDHYFGTYPAVRGFADPRARTGVFEQAYPANTAVAPVGRLLPWHLDTLHEQALCTTDITHDWLPQHQAWNGGAMDGFGTVHQHADPDGKLTMGYYTRADLPYYYALADAFTICDAYFCSVLGPTHPNRLMSMSATIDPAGVSGGPVLHTNAAVSYEGSASWVTMPERLSAHGITWKVYEQRGPQLAPGTALGAISSDNVLLYFKQFLQQGTDLYRRAFTPAWPDDFVKDVQSGELPQVSWVLAPTLPPDPADEHPPAPVNLGEQFTAQVLETLQSNGALWARTVVFLTYDENGGFFDHVPPPTAPPGTAGEYVTAPAATTTDGGVTGPIGLGFRVPMLVLSPFSRGGWVSSEVFDHTSTLRFLEQRFGVEVPNLSAWRRSVTGDLTSTLDLSGPGDTSVPVLPSPQGAAAFPAPHCTTSTVIGDVPPLPFPDPQALPTQESGRRRRRPPRVC